MEPARETVFLALHGELDLSTSAVVEDEIAGMRELGFKRVVLDLRPLAFMDSSGLALIARSLDEPFAIVPGDGQPRQVLDLAGVLDAVPQVRERDAPAVSAARSNASAISA